ncbi:M48 family metalloprotease [Acidicapsa dinghuensis]|uniref:M48 family metalloprotease n=1 Tax=Acidicapsa dinghuensis TaxID=2218256 RepID=A0ABW1EBX0_9BACT|nr:M48 family metalloprotease [Acidicapsa dinghuensis]
MKFLVRSFAALFLLYGMVFAIADIYMLHHSLSIAWGIVFPIVFIGVQYLLSPWFIEWMLSIDWYDDALPTVYREYIEKLCAEQGLPVPRIGVIHSATPNAFCFGRLRSDARMVLTDGLIGALSEDEVKAVIAHELGHIAHVDFAVMAVASLAPLILYQIFVWTRSVKETRVIAFTAYAFYWISQFVLLALNRVREASADHYSACVTHAPEALSSALIKISYGMLQFEYDYREAVRKSGKKEAEKQFAKQRHIGNTVSLMGIANLNSNRTLGLALSDPAKAAAVMRWDLVNPWASVYELSSTHPLVAHRVRALNRQAIEMRGVPAYPLPETDSISFPWRFPIEFLIWAGPWISGILLLFGKPVSEVLAHYHVHFSIPLLQSPAAPPTLLTALGVTWMIRIAYRYHGEFQPMRIEAMLEDLEVSEMQPRAIELHGEVVGNGFPGAFWSPDLVLKDDTGLMFLLYRSSIPLGRLFFALSKADNFIGEQVTVKGWYRRGARPYVEISEISATVTKVETWHEVFTVVGKAAENIKTWRAPLTQRSYSRWIQFAVSSAVTAAGILWLLQ